MSSTLNLSAVFHPAPGATLAKLQHAAQAVWAAFTAKAVSQPVVLSRAEEAERLRAYAANFMTDDPEFANDLFAAADRHEQE